VKEEATPQASELVAESLLGTPTSRDLTNEPGCRAASPGQDQGQRQ